MKNFNPVPKTKSLAKPQTSRMSDQTVVKTEVADTFFKDMADVFIFIIEVTKERFSLYFMFKEFFSQCLQIGYKTLPLIMITGTIMGLVIIFKFYPEPVDFGALTMFPGMAAILLNWEMLPLIMVLMCTCLIGSGMGASIRISNMLLTG